MNNVVITMQTFRIINKNPIYALIKLFELPLN